MATPRRATIATKASEPLTLPRYVRLSRGCGSFDLAGAGPANAAAAIAATTITTAARQLRERDVRMAVSFRGAGRPTLIRCCQGRLRCRGYSQHGGAAAWPLSSRRE